MMNRFYRNYGNYYPQRNENSNYIKDYGPMPLAVNIKELAGLNKAFRTTLWTGNNLQITLMNIPTNESIGLEIHPNVDQFIQIEQGIRNGKNGRCTKQFRFFKKSRRKYGFCNSCREMAQFN